jgi:hypothetical protein
VTNFLKNRVFFLFYSILAVVRAISWHYFAGLNACDIYGGTWCPNSTELWFKSCIEDAINVAKTPRRKKTIQLRIACILKWHRIRTPRILSNAEMSGPTWFSIRLSPSTDKSRRQTVELTKDFEMLNTFAKDQEGGQRVVQRLTIP